VTRTLRTALAGRAHLAVWCSARCRLAGTLTVSRAAARRLGLPSRVVGSLAAAGSERVLLPVRLDARAAAALRRRPRALRVTATTRDTASGRVVQTSVLALRPGPRRPGRAWAARSSGSGP